MRIEYKTGGQRTVRDSVGRRLVRVGIAREVVSEKSGTYMTRDMRAQPSAPARPDGAIDSEFFVSVDGRATQLANATDTDTSVREEGAGQPDELTALRAEYQDVVGKRAYHGWDADVLREKIAEAAK